LIAATPRDLAVAWEALGGTVGPAPARAVTLADEALGRVDPGGLDAAREAAARLDATEVAGPSLAAFGAPRAVLITAEAAAHHETAESEAARVQLVSGAAQPEADVRTAEARLAELGAQLRAAVGDGVLIAPVLAIAPPVWDELGTVDAQLRATGRLTRLCGPVNGAGLVAVSTPDGVQIVAARMETALAAALRL
jgi:hypothetical protein